MIDTKRMVETYTITDEQREHAEKIADVFKGTLLTPNDKQQIQLASPDQEHLLLLHLQTLANLVELLFRSPRGFMPLEELDRKHDAINGTIHGTAAKIVNIFGKFPCFVHIHPAGAGHKLGEVDG